MTGTMDNNRHGDTILRTLLAGVVLFGLTFSISSSAWAQETDAPAEQTISADAPQSDDAKAEESTAAESTTEDSTTSEDSGESQGSEEIDASADESEASESDGGEEASLENDVEGENVSGEAVGDAESADEVEVEDTLEGLLIFAIILALFLVPMFIGNRLGKSLRMPDHGWKIALAIGTLAAAAVIISTGEIKYGPDLSGGITLIYELQDTAFGAADEDEDPRSSAERDAILDQLIGALTERVDPSGTKEVTIRKYGAGQIEIIIPKAKPEDLEFIERRIYTAGSLEFRITASPAFISHRPIIERAKELPPGVSELRDGDNKIAEWVEYSVDQFGPVDVNDERIVKRLAGSQPQALVLTNDGLDVTGDDLDDSRSGFGQQGGPEVQFRFNSRGAFKFGQLTGNHLPNPSGLKYQLGIMLDKKLLSAPSINSKITSQGIIEGIPNKEEVDFLVGILNAGSLPASLNKEPIFRETISPTLGAETVEKGKTAIIISLVAVMVFMLFYYRFAGLVACLALAANLILILGLMVLLKAAFTLPGLAGLVLTIGMSVDANVLIFERIREERARGAAMRMAIINGFARATQTIVDANVTTLITAIVIYKIAPDNVKGFGVTLILGIIMSMYSAIFLSRLIFDICERTRSLKELKMVQIIRSANFDFLGKRGIAAVCSLIIIGLGLAAVYQRGDDLLNIDFTGGSSVTMVLDEDASMPYGDVKSALEGTDLAEQNLSLVEVGEAGSGLRYTVSSVNQDVEGVQNLLHETFGEKLKTYNLEISDISAIPQSDAEDDDADNSASDRFAGGTQATVSFSGEVETDPNQLTTSAGVSYETVSQMLNDALKATDHSGAAAMVSNDDYRVGSARRFTDWQVKLALDEAEAEEVWQQLRSVTNDRPIFPLSNAIGGRVAGDLKTKAIAAVVMSLIGIVGYIWFRFQRMIYGFAAVIALIHDVLVTLGAIGFSALIVDNIPALASSLMVEKFQISLPMVAAFLTIIGYSLNDTIVVFDRIREVKGKSPDLTADMINTSINQTLSRTLLTSATTLLSVILLYTLGGDGIHGFAYALVIGVIVGTYSSVFIASPALLWMSKMTESNDKLSNAKTIQPKTS